MFVYYFVEAIVSSVVYTLMTYPYVQILEIDNWVL